MLLTTTDRSPVTDRHVKALREQLAGNYLGAIERWLRILRKHPRDPKALYFLGLAWYQTKDLYRAAAYLHSALQYAPKHADTWYNLGRVYAEMGQPQRALEHYVAALECDPAHTSALTNAGNLYLALGDEEGARMCYHMALAQQPANPEARYNRSFLRLLRGDFAGGWMDYEARWSCPAYVADYLRPFMREIPMWDGSPLEGRHILLHGEQGLGDVIQMLRFVHWSGFRGHATLEVQAPLARLCAATFGEIQVITRDDPPPAADLQCPLLSLPLRFGVTAEDRIPRGVPYLAAPLAPALARDDALTVAIVWAGSRTHSNDADRSTSLDRLAPLFEVPDVHWVSLQVGERAGEADAVPQLERLDAQCVDFAATAALLAQCDLLVTVDTAVAHLGGALGVPTWNMVPCVPEFRWLLDREDSPWYPTMRLWRRRRTEAWTAMAREMAAALAPLAAATRAGRSSPSAT